MKILTKIRRKPTVDESKLNQKSLDFKAKIEQRRKERM